MSHEQLARIAPREVKPVIEWSDKLSVGIQEIDEQHKVLVTLLNDLNAAIMDHHGRQESQRILSELIEYTRIHFAVEESLMRMLDYPNYELHKKHHEMLIAEIYKLHEKLMHDHKSISFELLYFLKKWLTKHIMEEDMEYGPFMLSKGVKSQYEKKGWMRRLWR